MSRIRRNLTYANVMSSIAVFLVVAGGSAYAANEWTGANIVDGSITGADVKSSSLTYDDIAPNTIGGARILDNSLAGADINEATLGKTPAATNADKLAGVAAKPVVRLVAEGEPVLDACTENPPRVATFCTMYFDNDAQFRWENYGGGSQPAAFYKDAFGIVHVEGLVRIRHAKVDRPIFILPSGYRPTRSRSFALTGKSIGNPRDMGSVDIATDGRVVLTKFPASADAGGAESVEYLSLDGIAFRTG